MSTSMVPVEQAALFLDLDGTIAPIEPTPSDVRPNAERSALLLWATEALDGRVAIISGRTVEEVDRIADGGAVCVAGIHGLQRRDAQGRLTAAEPHPALDDAADAFDLIAKARGGLLVERKYLSTALHYRGAPEAGEAVRDLAERLAGSTGLVFQGGDMVAELMTPGANKGAALTAFMQEPPFLGAIPIFVGDDLTDEAGFVAAAEAGGAGVLVGPPRPTRSVYRLDTPKEVIAWITRSLNCGHFSLSGAR